MNIGSVDRERNGGAVAGGDTRLDRLAGRVGRLIADRRWRAFVLALPGFIAIATGLVLSAFDGGYDLNAWYSAGLFLLVLLALVVTLERPRQQELSPLLWWGLVAYIAFVAFNFLSILWAAVPGDAWDGANRSLVLGLAFAIVVTRPWPRDAGVAALALVGFGVLALTVGTLVVGDVSGPLSQFVGGRLSAPAGYANAAAALFLIGFFPLVYLAAARVLPWQLRGLALGGATVLAQAALLTQSRGAAGAAAAAALLFVALVPQRWAALACMTVVAALTAVQFDTLTGLTGIADVGIFEARLGDARWAIVVSASVATAIGALGALLGGRAKRPSASLRRTGNWSLLVASTLGAVLAIAAIGNPDEWVESRWDDFRSSGYTEVESGDTRFGGSLGSNRYDFYRVSLEEFGDHPIAGIGSENFLVPYLQERRSNEAPHFPHSLVFRLLAQLGVVGTTALLAFLALTLVAVARRTRHSTPVEAGVAAAASAAFAVWFAQGLVDWLWAFTGLGVVAFAMLALAARSGSPLEADLFESRDGWRAGGRGAVAAFVTLLIAVSLVLPGIAARYVAGAYDGYGQGDISLALQRLDRAADLNFLSAEPLIAKGVIAQRADFPGVAARAFAEGVEREPDNWFARLELGMSLARRADREAAIRQVVVARRLNPGQPVVRAVLRRVRLGKEVDPVAVEAELEGRLISKLRPLAPPES